ncbi:MAG: TetR/AcrR family transcriptional regulator [Blautia sp.]|nr:TetR/AcrR family transcriptional regulator [Blautia sp.]
MENEKNKKVMAMYQAVWKLLDEGKDLHKLKVSDITECAGIGKGTAYEYFRSKEEIVSKAMHYNCFMQFHELEKRVMEKQKFREALETCFDWLSETADSRNLVIQVLKQTGELPPDPECLHDNGKPDSAYTVMRKVLDLLVQLGRKEKLICSGIPDALAALQILSQFLGFFVFQKAAFSVGTSEIEMTKKFLCDNIVKSLG